MTEEREHVNVKGETTPMTLVVDRNLTIVWADESALNFFGKDILNRSCHEALQAGGEPCPHCIVHECFEDRLPHTAESEVHFKGGRRMLRRTARPAEFRPDGSLQFVKEIIEDITPLRIYEKTMQAVEAQAGTRNGPRFLNALVTRLCLVLKAQTVLVGSFDPDHTKIHVAAHAVNGELAANFSYLLSTAPCRRLVRYPLQLLPSGLDKKFPHCEWLKEKGISGYMGVQLKDSLNQACGLLCALYSKEMPNPWQVETLIAMFARPAALALEQVVHQHRLEAYRHLTATSNDLLALVNRDFTYQVVNRAYAAFHGLTAEQMVGQSMPAVVGEAFFEENIRPLAEACLQGRQGHLQTWQWSFDRSRYCMDADFYPHYEKGANYVKGFILCARDITQNKKMEAGFRQAAKMEAIGRLAGGIVHDFNNILGAVIGYTDLALGIVEGQPDVTQFLKEIRQAGLRATELVKQILAFSRPEHEIRASIQPKQILKEALSLLRATVPVNIEFRTRFHSEAHIKADPIHLHQIVINLCTNAQHAMREHGGVLGVFLEDVFLGAEEVSGHAGMQAGAYVKMSFADTGCGMPANVQAKLFEPFFTTKAKGEGTGLGLTMAHSIVKSYHGRIDVRSKVGQGTTFDIFLPTAEGRPESGPVDEQQKIHGDGSRILVVDDDRNLSEIASKILEKLGYQTQAETDSGVALARFEAAPEEFDLLLCDVTMPGMTGDVLAQKVLSLRPDLPVILMTGHSNRINQRRIAQIGVKKLIFKPLSLHMLAEAVHEVLRAAHPQTD